MKFYWLHIYQGIRQTLRPNYYTRLLYQAKFLQLPLAIYEISRQMSDFLTANQINFDIIIPIACTKTRDCFSHKIAANIAAQFEKPLISDYFSQPYAFNFSKKKVLLVDDIARTGTNALIAKDIIHRYSKPKEIIFFVYLKSPALKSHIL